MDNDTNSQQTQQAEQGQPTQQQSAEPEPKSKEQLSQEAWETVNKKREEEAAKQQATQQQTAVQDPSESTDELTARYQEAMVKVGKKEKELRELHVQLEQIQKQAQEFEQWKQSLTDPEQRVTFLQSIGISPKDLATSMVLATEEPKTAEQIEREKMAERIAALEQQITAEREEKEKITQQQQQYSVYQYASKLIEDNKDKYPHLAAVGGADRLIAAYRKYQEEYPPGQYPDEHEVAAAVEKQLSESMRASIKRLNEYGVLQPLLAPDPDQITEQKPAQQANHLGQKQQAAPANDRPTLTNDLSATPDPGLDYKEILKKEKWRSQTLRDHAIRRAQLRASRSDTQ